MTAAASCEHHVAVLCPTGRDALLTQRVLVQAGIACMVCADVDAACAALRAGVGALLIAEEALGSNAAFVRIADTLARQPHWSDLPVLVLTTRGADSPTAARSLERLGNVALLERPLRVSALVSSARVALRARERQYQIRAHLAERERAEALLREADRRKDEFLATLAHELRNPLAPIVNAAYLLRMETQPEQREAATEAIDRQVQLLARLVEDLLDVSRISRGRVELRRVRVDLESIVRNAVELARPHLDEGDLVFTLETPPGPILIDADATRMSQAIANLLNNAAKFTPRGGSVELKVTVDDGDVTIRIKDSGIGIDPEMIPKIFDMFVQADNRLERDTGGLGIGLTLVRHFVELHGGSIEAKSGGLTLGSEFVVRIPVAADAVESLPAARDGREATAEREPGLRMLVVDDNRDNATTMATLLQMLGHDVAVANSGAEALERLAEAVPAVALVDIGMPGMNGYELAERIRSHPGGDCVYLIAMTGWGQESDRVRSKGAGFDRHMVKPVDLDQLLALLREKVA